MRRAHPTKYHEAAMKIISMSRNKIWTAEEEQLVVTYEIQNPSIKNINQHIQANVLPERTTDSIKGHRKTPGYRRLLAEKRAQIEEQDDPQPPAAS